MLLEKTGAVSGKYSKTFDLSGYAKGIYYMDVQEGGMNLGVKKIMVY
jgi:hypothetical protein